MAVLLVATLVLGALVYRGARADPVVSSAVRFSFLPPEGTAIPSGPAAPQMAVSPDGRMLAFAAGESLGKLALWIQPLASLTAQRLPGTEDARYPFWSPDSRSIGFFAHGKLKIVRLSGEPPRVLGDAAESEGGTWGTRNVIVFAPAAKSGLFRVNSEGGDLRPVTVLDKRREDLLHGWPAFLPDGRRFLFLVKAARSEHAGVYTGSIDSTEPTRLFGADLRATYAPPGYLIFGRQDTLMAQPFDANRLQFTGEARPIERGLANNAPNGRIPFAVSDTGVLVYRPSGAAVGGAFESRLQWFDRKGTALGELGAPGPYTGFSVSPDGTMVVALRSRELWQFDVDGRSARRLPVDSVRSIPVWSPDGTQLAYGTGWSALKMDISHRSVNGPEPGALLLESNEFKMTTSWSPDGRHLLYTTVDPRTGWDVWVLPLFGDRKPVPYLRSPAIEGQAQFSPDGRWVAYYSNESGHYEVYAQSFPGPGAKLRVSANGGFQPTWRRDGRELFYLDPDNNLMAVQIEPGSILKTDAARVLFKAPVKSNLILSDPVQYAVDKDGQRFLFKVAQHDRTPMTVVLNWRAALKN